MIDRLRLMGGYQGMFVSITMIDRRRLLRGLSRYIRICHRPISLIGGLLQEVVVSITVIDRLCLLGDCCKYSCIYPNNRPASLIGGVSITMIDSRRLLGELFEVLSYLPE